MAPGAGAVGPHAESCGGIVTNPWDGSTVRRLVLLCILALVVRLAVLFVGPWQMPSRAYNPDSSRYLVLGRHLAEHRVFGKAAEDGLVHTQVAAIRARNGTLPPPDEHGLRPESFRTPGYPVLIAALGAVHSDYRFILLFQCVLGASGVALMFVLARRLDIGDRGAWLAASLWAFHPALVLHDNLFMSETLFTVLGLAALALHNGGVRLIAAAALLAAAALVRPLGLLYLPALLAMTLARRPIRWPIVALAIGLAVLPSAAWALRNDARGEGMRVSTVGTINLLYYTVAYTLSEAANEEWSEAWPHRVTELSGKLQARVRPGSDVISDAGTLALEELRSHPAALVRVQLKSWTKLFLDHSMGELAAVLGRSYMPSHLFSALVLREPSATRSLAPGAAASALLWVGVNALLALGALAGVLRALRRRHWALAAVVVSIVVLFALGTGSVGLERFRIPAMIGLFLGSAAALDPAPRRIPVRAARGQVAG
jgi:hypothetical protein